MPLTQFFQKRSLESLYFTPAEKASIFHVTTLQNFRTVVELALLALKAAMERKVHLFDPLVGENACQIRAAIFVLLFKDEQCLKEIEKSYREIEKILPLLKEKIDEQVQLPGKKRKNVFLSQFLNESGVNIDISDLVILVLNSYFLTITKTSQFSLVRDLETGRLKTSVNEDNVQKLVSAIQPHSMSKSASESFYRNARQVLSHFSVRFISENADPQLKSQLDHYLIQDQRGIFQVPCFYSVMVICKLALQCPFPIWIDLQQIDEKSAQTVDTITLYYKPDSDKTRFILLPNSQLEDGGEIFFRISAVSISNPVLSEKELLEELTKFDFIDWMLSFAAAHPQYGGVGSDLQITDNFEIAQKKKAAIDNGFCQENPRICQPWHIYPSF